ncbi:MAG: hypothetical protein WB822_05015 [Rhodoplanes sp.]
MPVAAVYPEGRHRMAKVRAFFDFLVERFSGTPWHHLAARGGQGVATSPLTD